MLALTRCLLSLGWDTVKLFYLIGPFFVLSYPRFPFQMQIIVSSIAQGVKWMLSPSQLVHKELLTAEIYNRRLGDLVTCSLDSR